MKVRKLSIRALALWGVAIAATACNFEDQLMPERVTSNPGRIAIECEVDSAVSEEITRASDATEGDEVPEGMVKLPDFITNLLYKTDANGVPTTEIDKGKLALRIWGMYDDPSTKDGANKDNLEEKAYAKAWDPMTEYEQGVELERGYYQARIENRPTMKDGKIAEAVNNPYFAYETAGTAKFQVKALETTSVTAKLKLMNSCFKLQTTQALMDYYTELKLVIHTADGEFEFTPTKSATSTVDESTTTPMNTNDVIAWESDADKLYFFNVSEPIKIDDGKSNGLVETPQSTFTEVLKLSGYAVKQNGVKVYFTKNGKADGEPAELKPVKDNKPVDLATGTMYTLRVGHKTAGGAGLTITYNDYGEAEVTIIELRPEETDDENAAGGDDNENQNPGQTPEQGQN